MLKGKLRVRVAMVGVATVLMASMSACGDSKAGAEGEIVVGTIQPLTSQIYSNPNSRDGLQAAIDAINAEGGISGKKVRVQECDSNYDANKELSCVRDLIDADVSAIVAPYIIVDQAGRPQQAAEKAGIPWIGARGVALADMQSKVSFPLSSGQAGWAYGTIATLIEHGAKNITVLIEGSQPASQYQGKLQRAALEAAGMTGRTVEGDSTADPTWATAAAQAAAGGTDGIVITGTPAGYAKAVQALRSSGYKGLIASMTSMTSMANLEVLGDVANGILLVSQFAATTDTENPGIAQFLEELKKYAPDAVVDESTLAGWAAGKLFAAVMKGKDDFSKESVLAAFKNLSDPVDISVIPPYSVVGKEPPLQDEPRMFNNMVMPMTIKDVSPQAVGGFIDPFESLAKASGN
ncbi:ABC transporter substrate-binding protein [Rhodococcus sp. NPDC056960]|uniref:ABC transporter substrate-binding protein n=1 Tax=Rhodococcus TaxID=1827 RepID=UPI0036373267